MKLTQKEKKYQDFLNNYEKDVCEKQLKEIVKISGVNKNTIIRYYQKLGYKGFTEYRYTHKKQAETPKINLLEKNPIVYTNYMDILNKINTLDEKAIEILKNIAQYENVYIVGQDSNVIICQILNYILNKIEIKSIVLSKKEGIKLSDKDLVFAISMDGKCLSTIDFLSKAYDEKAKTIGMSKNNLSPIRTLTDSFVLVDSGEKELDILAFGIIIEQIIFNLLKKEE